MKPGQIHQGQFKYAGVEKKYQIKTGYQFSHMLQILQILDSGVAAIPTKYGQVW